MNSIKVKKKEIPLTDGGIATLSIHATDNGAKNKMTRLVQSCQPYEIVRLYKFARKAEEVFDTTNASNVGQIFSNYVANHAALAYGEDSTGTSFVLRLN